MNRREFLMTAAATGLAGCATSGEKACCASAGKCGKANILFGACRPLRDAKILKAHGYDFIEATPIDNFPMTSHTECVSLMRHS